MQTRFFGEVSAEKQSPNDDLHLFILRSWYVVLKIDSEKKRF